MKTLKTIAASAVMAATMVLSINTNASPGPIIIGWTVEQCWELSGQIDAAYRNYVAIKATGDEFATAIAYSHYQQLNSQYNTYCWNVPHAY